MAKSLLGRIVGVVTDQLASIFRHTAAMDSSLKQDASGGRSTATRHDRASRGPRGAWDEASSKGSQGEALVGRRLSGLSRSLHDGEVLRNLYVPTSDGRTSEVDLAFVTTRGVFVIESKNFSGWIFGRECDLQWTQCLPNGEKNRFYNPIRQNRGHVSWLQRYLGDDTPLWSVIVFSERCELKNVTVTSPDVRVVTVDELEEAIRKLWDASPERLDEEQAEVTYERLRGLTFASQETKRRHVEDARTAAGARGAGTSPTHQAIPREQAENAAAPASAWPAAPTQPPAQAMPICPSCGRPLVLRTARRGPTPGARFYGCSGYPACHYMCGLEGPGGKAEPMANERPAACEEAAPAEPALAEQVPMAGPVGPAGPSVTPAERAAPAQVQVPAEGPARAGAPDGETVESKASAPDPRNEQPRAEAERQRAEDPSAAPSPSAPPAPTGQAPVGEATFAEPVPGPAPVSKPSTQGARICPVCGNFLVLRTARRGPTPGARFYGCASYPNCSFTLKL